MTFLAPQSDRAVRSAVEAFIEGKLRPQVDGEAVFETRNSRYRLIDGTLYSATDASLVGAELVGWLTEMGDESHVAAWWRPGVRAVLVDRRNGRHIVVTSATRLLRVEGNASSAGSAPHLGGSGPSHAPTAPAPMGWSPSTSPIGPNAPAYGGAAASPIPFAPPQPQPAAAPPLARDPRSLRPSSPADPHPAAPAMAIPPAPPIPRIVERPAAAPPHPPPRPIASPPRPASRGPGQPPRPNPTREAPPPGPMAAQRGLPRAAPPPTKGPLPRFPSSHGVASQERAADSSTPASEDNAPTQRRLPNLAAAAPGDRDGVAAGGAHDRSPRSSRPRALAPPPGPMAAPRSGRAAPPAPEGAPLSRRPAPMR